MYSLIGRNSFFYGRWVVLSPEKAALVSIDDARIIGYNHVKAFFSACDKTTRSLDFPFKVIIALEKAIIFAVVNYIFCWNIKGYFIGRVLWILLKSPAVAFYWACVIVVASATA